MKIKKLKKTFVIKSLYVKSNTRRVSKYSKCECFFYVKKKIVLFVEHDYVCIKNQ